MWALFWRLYAAHLFADFPLQNPDVLRKKSRIGGLLLHSLLVFAASLLVVTPAFLWRPALLGMVVLLAAAHFAIDWTKSFVADPPARVGLILFLADQLAHVGVVMVLAAAFGWGYYYGSPGVFARLAFAVFALWGGPVFVHIARSAARGEAKIGIYRERFAKLALTERALLFLGASAKNVYFVVAGVLGAVIIRTLLVLNEENVPLPVWEWCITLLCAAAGRLAVWGALI